MFMNRFFQFCVISGVLTACSGGMQNVAWDNPYNDDSIISEPTTLEYGTHSEYGTTQSHNISVLLPLSGENASIGRSIQQSIEIALFQNQQNPFNVKFFDTAYDINGAINGALSSAPEFIIGPVFANDARLLRDLKDSETPVLSFTSDSTAVGNGVMTMALMPINSIEAIIGEIASDKRLNTIIIAPDTISGHLMAGAAIVGAETNDIEISGVFYYPEGDTESIKTVMLDASMNKARTSANTKAREILSDILTNETLTPSEKSLLNYQLEKLSKEETIGDVPYKAVLFLGNADDTKSLASFLRYYGVDSHKVAFYGTALWDGSDIALDFTMTGAKYAALPETNESFQIMYSGITGNAPSRIAGFGYDATRIATGMFYSQKTTPEYLLNPSGFNGIDGIIKLKPTGDNERALSILQLNASGTPREIKPAAKNFIKPLYNIEQSDIRSASEMELQSTGIDPMDYIKIPDRFKKKYNSKKYGATIKEDITVPVITVVPDDNSSAIIESDYKSLRPESIKQNLIDSVEIEE